MKMGWLIVMQVVEKSKEINFLSSTVEVPV